MVMINEMKMKYNLVWVGKLDENGTNGTPR